MRKIFVLILLSAFTLSSVLVFSSCAGGGDVTTTTTQTDTELTVSYLSDGASIEAPEGDNYVAYVASTDDSRWFSWSYADKTVLKADSELEYTVHIFYAKQVFDSAEELELASGFSVGDTLGIRSYYKGVNRGAGLYKVTAQKPSHKGFLELSDGLYAELVPFVINGERRITVDQFGAMGDGEKEDHRRINYAFEYLDSDVVEFESPIYLQGNTLELTRGNVRINGKGTNIINRYERIRVNCDFSIVGSSDENRLENVTIEYLTLTCTEDDGAGVLYEKAGHGQFSARYTKNLTVRYCRFIVPFYEDLEPRQVGSVSIRCSIDTLFENNYLQNLCGAEGYSGGLWFWSNGEDMSEVSKNIVIRNNYIEKTGHDETLAFFMGAFEDILVENNHIYTHDEPVGYTSAHVIGFGVWDCPTSVKNAVFTGNKVDGIASRDLMMFSHVESIKVYDNELTVRCNTVEDPIGDAVFRVTYLPGNYAQAGITKVTQKDVQIYGNTIKVYNTAEIPMADPSCGEGFTITDNEMEFIPVTE